MYSVVVVVFPETGRHDGSSVNGENARKFRSENFWDFTKSMDFFGIIRLVMGEQVTLNEMSIYIMGEEVTLNEMSIYIMGEQVTLNEMSIYIMGEQVTLNEIFIYIMEEQVTLNEMFIYIMGERSYIT
jgi:hypothetical protein